MRHPPSLRAPHGPQRTPWAAVLLLGLSACFSTVHAGTSVYVQVAPPAPLYEAAPPMRPGYVWAPGHWEWNGRNHVWVHGRHIVARRGYTYDEPRWVQNDGRWAYRPGAWRHGRGDRDHDGIPNRMERDRDRDGVPNRRDRDRDGDGIRNRWDRHPDNGNRP